MGGHSLRCSKCRCANARTITSLLRPAASTNAPVKWRDGCFPPARWAEPGPARSRVRRARPLPGAGRRRLRQDPRADPPHRLAARGVRRADARHPGGDLHQQGRRRDARAASPRSWCAASARGMWVGTFHGIAHRLLRLHWQDAKLPGKLPGARSATTSCGWSSAWSAARDRRGALPAAADRLVDQRAEGRRPAPAAHPARAATSGRRDAARLRRIPAALRPRRPGRLRRTAAARA